MRDEKGVHRLCDEVREIAFALHGYLRDGHFERVYENGPAHRLRRTGLNVEQQKEFEVADEDGFHPGLYVADLFVEDRLIIEVKACRALAPEHVTQVLGYLRSADQRDALLINFGAPKFQIRKLALSRSGSPSGGRPHRVVDEVPGSGLSD